KISLAIEQTNARVQIPAVLIKRALGWKRTVELLDVYERHLLDMHKTDDHVRDLHPSVVDVVLYFDAIARSAQNAHERVAEHGVAHVTDVGRFIRVDAG